MEALGKTDPESFIDANKHGVVLYCLVLYF